MTTTEQLEARLTEAFDALWDSFVDPREAYAGEEGDWWGPVGSVAGGPGAGTLGPMNEGQLRDLREECRRLSLANEFAINAVENRISYVVGSGHKYQAVARRRVGGSSAGAELALRVQDLLDAFHHGNRWHQRQQEVMRRMDRDGEALLRLFDSGDGKTTVRFVEPDQVSTPAGRSGDAAATFGVLNRSGDVEGVLGYFVDGSLIDVAEVQHRKANVDSNVKRGLPLFAPVRSNLRRAEKLLRNMSVVAEIQSAIALIRKHRGATRTGVEQFVADNASGSVGSAEGRTRSLVHYGPGTILDAPAGLEYDFPATGIDASSFVEILQAELRAIAARLVMPEFMFTSNASNANFASTMVAEGPAVRMFERLQASMVEDDCELLWRVIDRAVRVGRLPSDTRQRVELQITPPSLQIRDRLQKRRWMRLRSSMVSCRGRRGAGIWDWTTSKSKRIWELQSPMDHSPHRKMGDGSKSSFPVREQIPHLAMGAKARLSSALGSASLLSKSITTFLKLCCRNCATRFCKMPP